MLLWAASAAAGLGGWQWLRTRSAEDGVPWPLRGVHDLNERAGRELFAPGRLAREFDPSRVTGIRVNGWYGAPAEADPADWRVSVSFPDAPERSLTLAEVFADLPRAEMTTEFKCIEGWSEIATWSGVRFADFAARLGVGRGDYPYADLRTPDGAYFVGLDADSLFHPQTLLCDRLDGAPLTHGHGAPLRLVLTVKYGIKNIKWLRSIRFAARRPSDYWAERGYDWYAGL